MRQRTIGNALVAVGLHYGAGNVRQQHAREVREQRAGNLRHHRPRTDTSAPGTSETTGRSGDSTSATDATVLGSQLANPSNPGTGVGSDVLGSQQEQSPTGTLPRTGGDVGGYLLLAGLALVLGGLAVRFGQAEPALS